MEILPESTSNSSAVIFDEEKPESSWEFHRRLKGHSSGSKNSSSNNHGRTRRQKRQKLNPMFGTRNRDEPIRSLGLKIEIPEFTCKVHRDYFIDWRRIEGKSKVETWEKMKKLMKAKFLPENHHQEAFLDYHNLSQQNLTVEEVINEFDKLRMRCDVVEEEDRFTPPTKTAPLTAHKTAPKATTPTTSAVGNTRKRVDNAPLYYKCGGLGHYVHDCLNLKTLAFVPDDACPIYDTNAEPELDEPGDELVYPDRREALVIQRVLNVAVSKSVDDNSWLRNNIFRTKCTSKGKIYDIIIDGCSCENVVSTYMVEKVGMKTEDHAKPYELTWLKKVLILVE
ncbi:reverse transcriptase domain-containing protein [Tanacetum coccineum]